MVSIVPNQKTMTETFWDERLLFNLYFRYIDVNSIEKYIRKLFFIGSKEMDKFIRNLLIETIVSKN